MPRVKHILEYGALRGIGLAVRLLPYRGALCAGWIMAGSAHHIARFRVAEAKRRIREVLGAQTPAPEISRIAWASWRNLAFMAVDLLRMPALNRAFADAWVECEAVVTRLRQIRAETGRGAVLATLHMGSWELGGAACHLHGIPMFYVFAEQKNPLFNAYLNRLRTSSGPEAVARGSGTMKRVLRRLKAGQILAMPVDVRVPQPAVVVRFLGKTANVGSGMASFARQLEIPVVPAFCTRVGWARHRLHVHPSVWPDTTLGKQEDIARMTQTVFDLFDADIRARPGQWFWYNKRWILDPVR
ncbi:MAG: lysophospholipid acyltransferase family protein [Kiritimatiellae bacterium]|nr:lysophospholipid acyltransferase family protein [Kiritimatiellia bacterium]